MPQVDLVWLCCAFGFMPCLQETNSTKNGDIISFEDGERVEGELLSRGVGL